MEGCLNTSRGLSSGAVFGRPRVMSHKDVTKVVCYIYVQLSSIIEKIPNTKIRKLPAKRTTRHGPAGCGDV